MCDLNRTTTPRPPSSHTQPKRKTRSLYSSEFPNLSARHNKPSSVHASNLDNSDDDTRPLPRANRPSNAAHKVQKPNVMKNSSSAYVNTFNHYPAAQSKEVKSTLRKYGVEARDNGDYYSSRQGSQSRHSSDGSTDSRSQAVPKRKTSNSDRTRSTLDNLLGNIDDTSTHNLLAHIGSEENRRPEVNKSRPRVTVTSNKSRGNCN